MAKFSKGCYIALARAFADGYDTMPDDVADVVLACVGRVADVLQADNRAFDRKLFVAMVKGEVAIPETEPSRKPRDKFISPYARCKADRCHHLAMRNGYCDCHQPKGGKHGNKAL